MSSYDAGLDPARVKAQFNQAAARYDQHAVFQQEIARRLDERFDYLKIEPRRILDLGCGTGQMIELMRNRYRDAQVWGLDLAHAMLAEQSSSWWERLRGRAAPLVCADMHALPLRGQQFDVVVSSLALQWSLAPDQVFDEVRRLLRPGGVLMFATLGPGTLGELRHAWREVDGAEHVHRFIDMHDLGDALLRAGLADPVMDVERVTMTYPNLHDLLRDIKGVGASSAYRDRARGLLTPRRLRRLEAAYEAFRTEQGLPLGYEVVYGHAWGVGPVQRRVDDAVVVPLETLNIHKKL